MERSLHKQPPQHFHFTVVYFINSSWAVGSCQPLPPWLAAPPHAPCAPTVVAAGVLMKIKYSDTISVKSVHIKNILHFFTSFFLFEILCECLGEKPHPFPLFHCPLRIPLRGVKLTQVFEQSENTLVHEIYIFIHVS